MKNGQDMRHRITVTAALCAAALTLTACSDSGDGDGDDSGTLIVYTNSNSDGRDAWLTEQAAEAGFTIEVVGQGAGETTNKILAEVNNPVADVVFGLNHLYFSQLVEAETIEPYTPSWSDEVDQSLGDSSGDGNYWPVVQQGIVLTYNTAAYPDGDAPTDWTDLWNDPRFHGRYQTETGMGGGTTQLVFSGLLTRYQDPDGELGVSDEGWQEIEGYFENGSPAVPEVDVYARMADDEVDMGQMWTSGIPEREAEYGIDSEIMAADIGVPLAVEQVAMVKGTSQAESAGEFIDWFGSADVQAAWSAEFGTMPANEGAIEQADPAVVELHANLQPQDVDWVFVSEHLASWIEKIELEYVG
jgi:iron(III) transport system substrate-binding protein